MTRYRPDPRILALGGAFYDAVRPADFPGCTVRFVNSRWAERVGIALDDSSWARHFCRFDPLEGNLVEPLALRYHGHQFRAYNPEIGDGRGFLFAQLRDDSDRLLDLGTKGSGTTPYSRHADGRLTLKGAVRELLATEMLEALGVNTSKTFAIVETHEQLVRGDEPSPTRSAVLTRLSHGHVRIGTFQRLAFFGEADNIARLVAYCLEHLFAEMPTGDRETDAHRFFALAAGATATLAASYMAAAFVHGVLNSDNINVTGESFDYGPWRFTPHWDPDFTAAYFDHYGLYSFARQPEAIHWDLAQLAGALTLVAPAPPLSELLAGWGGDFEVALAGALVRRLGIAPGAPDVDAALAEAIIAALSTRAVTIDRFFFDWRSGRDPGGADYAAAPFRALAPLLDGRRASPAHAYWSDPASCSMHIDEVEAIWAAIAEADDWRPLNDKVAAIRRMGDAMASDAP